MGQEEVETYLRNHRLENGDSFLPARTIIKDLHAGGMSSGSLKRVRFNLVQLEVYGFIEGGIGESCGHRCRVWRIKKKYL